MYVFAGEGPLQIRLLRVVKPCQRDFLVMKGCKIRPLRFWIFSRLFLNEM